LGNRGNRVNCLICGRWGERLDMHHYPHAVGSGRKREKVGGLTVPLCRVCHTQAHAGHHTDRLIEEAPGYWNAVGMDYEQTFDVWLARRKLREADNG